MMSGEANPDNNYFESARNIAGVDVSPEWPRHPAIDSLVSLSRLALEQHDVRQRHPIVTLVEDPNPLSQKYGMVISKTAPEPGVFIEAVVYSVTADDYDSGQYVVWKKPIRVTMDESAQTPTKEQIHAQAKDVEFEFQRDELAAISAMAKKAARVYSEMEYGSDTGKPDNFHDVELAIWEEHIDDLANAPRTDVYQDLEYNNDEDIYEAGIGRRALSMMRKYEQDNPSEKRRTTLAKWQKIDGVTYAIRVDYTKPHFRSTYRDVQRIQVVSQDEEGYSDFLEYSAVGSDSDHQGEYTELAYDVENIFETMDHGALLDEEHFEVVIRYRNSDDIEVRLRDIDSEGR